MELSSISSNKFGNHRLLINYNLPNSRRSRLQPTLRAIARVIFHEIIGVSSSNVFESLSPKRDVSVDSIVYLNRSFAGYVVPFYYALELMKSLFSSFLSFFLFFFSFFVENYDRAPPGRAEEYVCEIY